jgi:hypothetical protein
MRSRCSLAVCMHAHKLSRQRLERTIPHRNEYTYNSRRRSVFYAVRVVSMNIEWKESRRLAVSCLQVGRRVQQKKISSYNGSAEHIAKGTIIVSMRRMWENNILVMIYLEVKETSVTSSSETVWRTSLLLFVHDEFLLVLFPFSRVDTPSLFLWELSV